MTDAERIKELQDAIAALRNGYADAVSGLRYIQQEYGKHAGVGWDRVYDHYFAFVEMPEREGLIAGSHRIGPVAASGEN